MDLDRAQMDRVTPDLAPDARATDHDLPRTPREVPPVPVAALLAAWDAAREAAGRGVEGPARRFRFAGEPGAGLLLTDRDGRCWAEALDRRVGLDTPLGAALLLRLLALVEVMGRAAWLRGHFDLGPGGTLLHPALLRAAATGPLDAAGRFEEEGLRARLGRALPPARRSPTMIARSLPLLLLLAACAAPPGAAPRAAGRADATSAACRAEAERVVRYRDRGQLMRQDDYNARVGTSSYLGPQVMTDQIAQVFDRDRLAAACERGARGAEAAAVAGPTPAR